jgi:spoIIIJ-associated protein
MKREVTTEAPTVADAIDAALEELGVQQDAVGYEVIDEPGRRLFGMGADKSARVRVWLKDEYVREIEDSQKHDSELPDDAVSEVAVATSGFASADSEELPELSDEELDNVADQAVSVIKPILSAFGVDATIEEYEGDEGEIILDIVGGDCASLIGRHGRTLDALQALVSAITNRRLGFRYPVVVDVEGYRQRRREKLEEIARRGADRAARQGVTVKLRPMTAYERRLVHMALRSDRRVTTHSEGEDPYRQVVIEHK